MHSAARQAELSVLVIYQINNGIDAIIDYDRRDPWIRLAGYADKETVRIEVIDCGAGIPDDRAARCRSQSSLEHTMRNCGRFRLGRAALDASAMANGAPSLICFRQRGYGHLRS